MTMLSLDESPDLCSAGDGEHSSITAGDGECSSMLVHSRRSQPYLEGASLLKASLHRWEKKALSTRKASQAVQLGTTVGGVGVVPAFVFTSQHFDTSDGRTQFGARTFESAHVIGRCQIAYLPFLTLLVKGDDILLLL
jgi:hypothetical protein